MPRQLRIEYPGVIYHVLNRGDYREAIFRDELNSNSTDQCSMIWPLLLFTHNRYELSLELHPAFQ